ncbi:hypothetical protein CRUP_000914 [Coryphaenoides rupestris]|nr:hypothetical protein CRUP_000914 [Coryphaenoides rupestris]
MTESFYLKHFKLINSKKPPPPRPPKNNLSTKKSSKPEPLAECFPALSANSSTSEDGLSHLSIASKSKTFPLPQGPRKKMLPSPTTPHKSSATLPSLKLQGEVQSGDSDHDYESPDLDAIKQMSEYFFY